MTEIEIMDALGTFSSLNIMIQITGTLGLVFNSSKRAVYKNDGIINTLSKCTTKFYKIGATRL